MESLQQNSIDPVKDQRGTQGDLPPFEELFKLHHRKVYAVCLRMIGNTAEAEDLTQEVFIQVFRKLATFRGESAFTTWLHRLTINHVLMYFRKRRSRREQLTEEGELPERTFQGRKVLTGSGILDRLALDEAIVKLAPGYRAIFVLHDIEGLQHLEIANIMGCSVGTSKSQLHKARMKLRRLLRKRTVRGKAIVASPQIHKGLDRLAPSQSTPHAILSAANRSKFIGLSPAHG
jgi:RNA polymerase sigma-70 factor, ECF subfamily